MNRRKCWPNRVWVNLLVMAAFSAIILARTTTPAETFELVSEKSRVEIQVLKAGLFSAFGHNHQIQARHFTSELLYDAAQPSQSRVSFLVEAASLVIMDPELKPEDRAKVQSDMLSSKVLDVEKFPNIHFNSTQITFQPGQPSNPFTANVYGVLELHGQTRPIKVLLEIAVHDGEIFARGEMTLKQSDFGIKPISVAGGTVRVKDSVKIVFNLVYTKP